MVTSVTPVRPVLGLAASEGWRAQLMWLVDYILGWFTCLQSPMQALTRPLIESNALPLQPEFSVD